MTSENKLKIHELQFGESTVIGQVVVKKGRNGFFIISYDGKDEKFSSSRMNDIYDRIDEINTRKKTSKEDNIEVGKQYLVDGTDLIAIKNIDGTYSLYENGEFLTGVKPGEYEKVIESYRRKKLAQKVNEAKKQIKREATMNSRKKILYFFILTFSVILTIAIFVLGVKFDGVSFTRKNQDLYEVIYDIAQERYPEKKFDKFDAVYYTLNYYAHKQNYLMTETPIYEKDGTPFYSKDEDGNVILDENGMPIQLVIPAFTKTYIYTKYLNDGINMDLSSDHTYSGWEFNALFRYDDGRYMTKDDIYLIIWAIMAQGLIDNDYEPVFETMNDVIKIESVAAAYKVWDKNDEKVNRAYNWEYISADGYSRFDRNVDYYKNYLSRNGFIKIFLNDSSKFIHEYNLFETIGWLSWVDLAVIILFIFLAIFIWLFDHSEDKKWKLSKGFIIFLGIVGLLVATPLVLQYLFEGLNKNATAFLDVVENTTFTTTTTFMNFVFDWIVKLANIVFTGVVTVALPLKIVRYFVHKQINKVTKNVKVTKIIAPGTSITEDVPEKEIYDTRL